MGDEYYDLPTCTTRLESWNHVDIAATGAILDLRVNPTDTAQRLALLSAAKGYEQGLEAVRSDIDALWESMESFEDFRSGLDELLEARLTGARNHIERDHIYE